MADEDRTALVYFVAWPSSQQAWSPSQIGDRPLLAYEEHWEVLERPVSYL